MRPDPERAARTAGPLRVVPRQGDRALAGARERDARVRAAAAGTAGTAGGGARQHPGAASCHPAPARVPACGRIRDLRSLVGHRCGGHRAGAGWIASGRLPQAAARLCRQARVRRRDWAARGRGRLGRPGKEDLAQQGSGADRQDQGRRQVVDLRLDVLGQDASLRGASCRRVESARRGRLARIVLAAPRAVRAPAHRARRAVAPERTRRPVLPGSRSGPHAAVCAGPDRDPRWLGVHPDLAWQHGPPRPLKTRLTSRRDGVRVFEPEGNR